MKFRLLSVLAMGLAIGATGSANAIQYDIGDWGFRLTGYGTIGMIQPDIETPVFIGDWRVRGQVNWRANENHNFASMANYDRIICKPYIVDVLIDLHYDTLLQRRPY